MKEFYYELSIAPSKYLELYLDLILSLSHEALEEFEDKIILRSQEPFEHIITGVELFTSQLNEKLNENIICDIKSQKKQNVDWVSLYQDSVQAVEVGKFYIHPQWCEQKHNKINVLINPALAFGSGHHETTSSCLEAISKYTKKGDTLIDVGTGSGILAIAASKLHAICDICDTDEVSIINSKENFELNNTSYNDAWVGSASKSNTKYNIVVANIVADVLVMIKKDLHKILKEDGILIISGILDKYEDKILKKYKDFIIKDKINKNEWITLVLIKDNNE